MTGDERRPAPQPTDAARPWVPPGAVRRDPDPHRSNWLLALAYLALFCSILGICLVVPALAGIALAVTVQVLADRDLARMRAGRMDPAGIQEAVRAEHYAAAAVACAMLPLFCCVPMLVSAIFLR